MFFSCDTIDTKQSRRRNAAAATQTPPPPPMRSGDTNAAAAADATRHKKKLRIQTADAQHYIFVDSRPYLWPASFLSTSMVADDVKSERSESATALDIDAEGKQ